MSTYRFGRLWIRSRHRRESGSYHARLDYAQAEMDHGFHSHEDVYAVRHRQERLRPSYWVSAFGPRSAAVPLTVLPESARRRLLRGSAQIGRNKEIC